MKPTVPRARMAQPPHVSGMTLAREPATLICLALVLALIALAVQIAHAL